MSPDFSQNINNLSVPVPSLGGVSRCSRVPNMKQLWLILNLIAALVSARAGDVTDLGIAPKVPDWAVGPLLVVSNSKVEDKHLNATKEECVRIGTIQAKSIELFGRRFPLASIHLYEIPNDSKQCVLQTEKEQHGYYRVHLSQSLFDQTYYHITIEWVDSATERAADSQQFAVWDTKSRK